MLQLTFTPASPDLNEAADSYKRIWAEEGERILEAITDITSLHFQETRVDVMVYEGMSFAGKDIHSPMRLRASYSEDVKKATLIHELGHRLLFQVKERGDLDEHQVLYLFLYDVWTRLYGAEFAQEQVAIESQRKGFYDYEKAWQWALKMTQDERRNMCKHL